MFRDNQHGLTIVETLISVAMAAFGAYILAIMVPKYNGLLRAQELSSQRNAIRTIILNKMSCERTDYYNSNFSRTACNGVLNLYSNDRREIFPGNVWGDWNVKVSCSGATWRFQVARLKPGQPITATASTAFKLDPVTKAPDSWSNILPPGPCSDYDGAVEFFGGSYSEIGGTNICYGSYMNSRTNPPSCTCPYGYRSYLILNEDCCTAPNPTYRPDTFYCFKERR